MESDREVTIYDVAKALHLSPSTVSRGLKDNPLIKKETRDKIKALAREMGYQPNKFASSLRQKKTETIGVVVPRLNSYFQATVIAGIEKVTNEHGYGLLISQSQESARQEASCIKTLYNSRIDGLIVSLASDTRKFDHFNIILDKGIPVVFFDRVADYPGCISIIIDNCRAGYEITNHLIEQGCSRIMHLGGNQLRNVYNERFGGYKQALIDHSLEFRDDLFVLSELTHEAGIKAAREIMKLRLKPDGIFAANDASAVAMICELRKSGIRIPEDIAVAGFNNDPSCQVVQPNLTTIEYPAQKIGVMAAESLISRLKSTGPVSMSNILIEHKLIIRESTLRQKT